MGIMIRVWTVYHAPEFMHVLSECLLSLALEEALPTGNMGNFHETGNGLVGRIYFWVGEC